jgi:hypothetical protein
MAQSRGSSTALGPSIAEPAAAASAGSTSGQARIVALYRRFPLELIAISAVAILLLFPFLLNANYFGLPFDDSYISLLFARNLADHAKLSFDGATWSAGATSPLHVALLAVPLKAGVEPITASIALGATLHVALICSVYWLANVIFHRRLTAAIAATFAAITGFAVLDALNGMETTLFMVMTTLTVAAFFSARSSRAWLAAGILAALALLTRPEALVLLGAMVLYEIVCPRDDRSVFDTTSLGRFGLLVAPSVVALAALTAFYYGVTDSFQPGTASAKLWFFREFESDWTVRWDHAQIGLAGFATPLLPFIGLSAFSIRRKEALLFAFLWIPFFLAYFALFPGGLSHYWFRYQHVFMPPIFVFAAAGLVSLTANVSWNWRSAIAASAIGGILLIGLVMQYDSLRNNYAKNVNLNEGSNVKMAEFIRDKLPPDATVATHDIGVVGYYSDREIIDLVGLVNPEVVDYHDGRRLSEYVERVKPDFVLLFPSWEFNFLHLGLHPYIYEPICGFPGVNEPYILYRTHYEGEPSDTTPIPCEKPAFVIP